MYCDCFQIKSKVLCTKMKEKKTFQKNQKEKKLN